MTYIDIKLDQSSLPANGQKVKFDTYNVEGRIGEYVEEEQVFWPIEGEEDFFPVSAFEVYRWSPIE